LRVEDFQVREERPVIADLIGKGKHIRTVPVPMWAKRTVDEWTAAAGINGAVIFRRVSRLDKIWGAGITAKAIWHVVKAAAKCAIGSDYRTLSWLKAKPQPSRERQTRAGKHLMVW